MIANVKNYLVKIPTSLTAFVTFVVLTAAQAAGLDISPEVAAAAALVLIGAVSYISPRSSGFPRPAGLTAALVTVLVWFGPLLGLNMTAEQATALVGLLPALIGATTPRR